MSHWIMMLPLATVEMNFGFKYEECRAFTNDRTQPLGRHPGGHRKAYRSLRHPQVPLGIWDAMASRADAMACSNACMPKRSCLDHGSLDESVCARLIFGSVLSLIAD